MAELTCPKCGMKYYGVGCPNCDYPPVPVDPNAARQTVFFGCLFLAIGLVFVALYFFNRSMHEFKIFDAGFLFAIAGFHTAAATRLYKTESRVSAFICGLMMAAFAYIPFYAAFSKGRISGGIPFLPYSWNQYFGKFIFGAAGVGLAIWSLYLFYRVIKPKRKE